MYGDDFIEAKISRASAVIDAAPPKDRARAPHGSRKRAAGRSRFELRGSTAEKRRKRPAVSRGASVSSGLNPGSRPIETRSLGEAALNASASTQPYRTCDAFRRWRGGLPAQSSGVSLSRHLSRAPTSRPSAPALACREPADTLSSDARPARESDSRSPPSREERREVRAPRRLRAKPRPSARFGMAKRRTAGRRGPGAQARRSPR